MNQKTKRAGGFGLMLATLTLPIVAQTKILRVSSADPQAASIRAGEVISERTLITSVLPLYYSQDDGISLQEIVRRSIESNGELKIARLEVDRARSKLTQAGLRPNPVLEIEQTTGRLVGSPGDGSLTLGMSLPLEVYGQRKRRIEQANAEIELREAEVKAHERQLTREVFTSYAEALAALKELAMIEELLELDTRTTRFVQVRVNEGDVAPLELNLLQTEVERLRSRRQLVEGKLRSAITQLKFLAGFPYEQTLKLREEISTAVIPQLPPSVETGVSVALLSRPEIAVARLEEDLASAGLRLIRAQSRSDVTAFTRYSQGRSIVDDPRGAFAQRDRSVSFGLAVGIPVFNRNQGAKAEAEIVIRQAQEKRLFAEQIVRKEVLAAFQRLEATSSAVSTLERAVLPRSRQNVETVRQVYEVGELKITDLIAEQRRLLDASRDLTESLTERYRAQADLFIALGIRLED